MDEILHHFDIMGNHCSFVFTGESNHPRVFRCEMDSAHPRHDPYTKRALVMHPRPQLKQALFVSSVRDLAKHPKRKVYGEVSLEVSLHWGSLVLHIWATCHRCITINTHHDSQVGTKESPQKGPLGELATRRSAPDLPSYTYAYIYIYILGPPVERLEYPCWGT